VPSTFWIDREVHIGRMLGVERTIEEKKMAKEDCLLAPVEDLLICRKWGLFLMTEEVGSKQQSRKNDLKNAGESE
jgi:hypothetical protein